MKKQRIQYNWKFRENESPEIYEWFENQENISSSLRNMLYHMIELYGTADVLSPAVQRECLKNSLVLESLKGKNVIQVDSQIIEESQTICEQKTTSIKETVTEIPIEKITETPVEIKSNNVNNNKDNNDNNDNNSIYGEIDPNAV